MCSSRKYPYSPQQKGLEIPWWWGEGGGVSKAQRFPWGRYGYLLEPHNVPSSLYKVNLQSCIQGFWYFAEKSADFAGFSREKSQYSRNNRPISSDFRLRKVKIHRKIGPFGGILAENSQFSKDVQGQILRKIGRFHRKFRGETSPRNNQ